MSKHTKGPWEVNAIDDDTQTGEVVVWELLEGKVIGAEIVVPSIWLDDEQAIANANLITAAPDLLDALEGCLEALRAYNPECGQAMMARAAIAKAKGESA